MKSFWKELSIKKKPFFALAPMEAAVDTVFRRIITLAGKPDVYFTEFTNVEGLFSTGKDKIERRLKFTHTERPLIAQIWGLKLENFYKAALYLRKLGFDGVDINMGCPDKAVTAKGACSALINNISLAGKIILAVKEGALDLPVSVKTRLGFSNLQTEEWIGFLLTQDLDALIIHARTSKEMSKVPAHWDEIAKAVKLRNKMKKKTIIIGNGDIKSITEGIEKAEKYGVEGVMIGRGIFENAWIFNERLSHDAINVHERLILLNKHLLFYEQEKGEKLPFQTLKKYFKIYIRDFNGALDLRARLMETNTLNEAKEIVEKLLV